MELAYGDNTLVETRITLTEPISDDAFMAIAGRYPELRAELDGPNTVVLMPPHGLDSSARNAELIRLVGNWNAGLPEPGVVFDSDCRFRWPEGSLKGPDTAWISAPRYRELEAAGKAFADIVPEIVVELRSKTDRWPIQIARCEAWVKMGAPYAIAIDPYAYRLECKRSVAAGSSSPFAAELNAVLAIARKISGG